MPQFKIKNLSNGQADCFLILLENIDGDKCSILIDGNREGGKSDSFCRIKDEIENLEKLDYIIITHIDNDHLGGILSLFKEYSDNEIKQMKDTKLIYNYITKDKISYTQAKDFEKLIEGRQVIQSFKETYEKKNSMLKILTIAERNIATKSIKHNKKKMHILHSLHLINLVLPKL